MDRNLQIVVTLLPIVGVGIGAGVFQERLNSHTESIKHITNVINSMDVIEVHLKAIDSRLNRIEYGRDYITSSNGPLSGIFERDVVFAGR